MPLGSGWGTRTVDDFPQRPPEKEEHAACGQSRSARDWDKMFQSCGNVKRISRISEEIPRVGSASCSFLDSR